MGTAFDKRRVPSGVVGVPGAPGIDFARKSLVQGRVPQVRAPNSGPEKRPVFWRVALGLGALASVIFLAALLRFPADTTPEGAYLRVVKAVNRSEPEQFFAYTEEAAQHACFTIGAYRKQLLEVARGSYPPKEFQNLEARYGKYARAKDGHEVFALMARQHGWLGQLRLDVSGIARTEIEGPRATVETAKGTRYALRKRPNGIWGLTAFTPTLVEEAERAARDLEQVKKSAQDFAREKAGAHP